LFDIEFYFEGLIVDKGIIVIIAVGVAFVYFATGMFKTSDSQDDTKWAYSAPEKTYKNYYVKDALGDNVLNFNSLSLDQSKIMWSSTPEMKKVIDDLPDFELAKADAGNALVDGEFRTYLLGYIAELGRKYLAGQTNLMEAKQSLRDLN